MHFLEPFRFHFPTTSEQTPDEYGHEPLASRSRESGSTKSRTASRPWSTSASAERWASAIGGTVLVASRVRQAIPSGRCAGLRGGACIYRGVSGHCSAYQALKIDTSTSIGATPTSMFITGA